ncbi:MAG: DMT family transporter [Ruminococcus sp.]|nr:DMT family transporter [Schaedlerella arabinosiphila]MCI8722183.1 DMT family transporter [Ruminococcus sp.]
MKRTMAAHAEAWLCLLLWGGTMVSTKILLGSVSPVLQLFLRFLIAYLTLRICYPQKLVLVDKKDELYFFICGSVGITFNLVFQNMALQYTKATNASVIIASAPMVTAVLVHLFTEEKQLHRNFVIGFILSMTGIVLVSTNGRGMSLELKGDLLVGCAALSWGIYSFTLRKIAKKNYDMLCCTRRIFFYGLLTMFPILPFVDCSIRPAGSSWIFIAVNLLYLGIFASAFCYAVWNHVSGILGVVKTNVYLYALPLVTFLFAALILKERVSAAGFCGIIFTIAGLILSERKPGKGKVE